MKKIVFLFLLVLLFFGFASAGNITRGFSSSSLTPGQALTVTLFVSLDNETFYLLDEIVPGGWTVIDAGSGSIEQQGHVKWVVIQNAASATYSYTVKAPSSEGTASFSGKYLFEGGSETEIAGAKTMLVAKAEPNPEPIPEPAPAVNSMLLAGALVIGAILIIAGILILKKKKKK